MILLSKKNKECFHKYYPIVSSPPVCAKFALEKKVQSSNWEMSNEAIFHFSVALNIYFYKIKSSRDTKICRKIKFQGAWT